MTGAHRPVRSLERSCYVFYRDRIQYPWTVCFTVNFYFIFSTSGNNYIKLSGDSIVIWGMVTYGIRALADRARKATMEAPQYVLNGQNRQGHSLSNDKARGRVREEWAQKDTLLMKRKDSVQNDSLM